MSGRRPDADARVRPLPGARRGLGRPHHEPAWIPPPGSGGRHPHDRDRPHDATAAQLTGEVAEDATEEEKSFVADEARRWQREGAYSLLHATKPTKPAYAMADSPGGVAAWIIEAFHAWSDLRDVAFEDLYTPDQLLTEVMLYLVTDAFPTSTWIYGAKRHEEATLPRGRRVEVPTAVAAFQDLVFPTPPRAVTEKSHHVVRYVDMPRGGHFPFYETPDLLVDDLRGFLLQLRQTPPTRH